jgi:hypothetical protein
MMGDQAWIKGRMPGSRPTDVCINYNSKLFVFLALQPIRSYLSQPSCGL